jgi:aminopeptidase
MTDAYIPSQKILNSYARVLINFALNSGEGVKSGEIVECIVPDVAKPLARELQNVILEAGAHPMIRLLPTEFEKDFFDRASADQLTFFPKNYLKSKVKLLNHVVSIIAQPNPLELASINPKQILLSRDSKAKYREWLFQKEYSGNLTWTVALWGEAAKAKIVGLSTKEYWDQIILACFLDTPDPVAEWKAVFSLQKKIQAKLNELKILSLHIEGDDVDLTIRLGAERAWLGGSGRNIPSFELFSSPDWRGTEGWIQFNQPLYRYGQILENIFLRFEKGVVIDARASKGEEFLLEMLKAKNANKVGEFSLTDSRMSRITHPMADTLFDENIGGPFGNMHLAVGSAYKDAYHGDPGLLSKKEWKELGYNDSPEHTDIVSTSNRTVTATHAGGKTVIYTDGKFVI